ncbi:MAG: DUF465 domain-containing protein [Nitrospinae bacterium]|nr:DUF465 domain-containing protein [Nitrospinota bacterium]
MEVDQGLLEKAKKDNPEFKKLFDEHLELKNKVDDLNKLKYLSAEQEIEKKTIKKQKLRYKDRMDQIISEYKTSLH